MLKAARTSRRYSAFSAWVFVASVMQMSRWRTLWLCSASDWPPLAGQFRDGVCGAAGVVPIVAGERLLAYAWRLLALGEQVCLELQGVAFEGTLRLGVTDSFRPAELAGLTIVVHCGAGARESGWWRALPKHVNTF